MCAKRRAVVMKQPKLPRHSLHSDKAFSRLQMDFLEGIGSPQEKDTRINANKATAILVIVCAHTRYVKLYPVVDKSAGAVKACLIQLFCSMGIAEIIVSDGTYVIKQNFNIRYLKLQAKFTGPYRVVKMADRTDFVDLYDLIEDRHEMEHRSVLFPVRCKDDETARKHFANDLREFHVEKILSHSGNPYKPSTLKFECKCAGIREPLPFEFKSLRLIPKFREYLRSHDELNSGK